MVANALCSKQVTKIKSIFHFVDNQSLTAADSEMEKALPLYDIIKVFAQFKAFYLYLSIDESMVPNVSRHSGKMFIRCKPIKFGFKIWMLCEANGYLYMYSGRDPGSNLEHQPLGTRVVNQI